MKKQILFLATLLFGAGAFAQSNTLPTNGNVGIGTLNPTERLAVCGSVKIDSSIVVSDSAVFQSTARIAEELKVEGQIVVPNMEDVTNFQTSKMVFIDENGYMKKGDTGDVGNLLGEIIYSKQCPPDPNDDVLHPVWVNGLNKIYIDCPPVRVGVGTSTPRTKLDVEGGIFGSSLMVGMPPQNAQAQFHMYAFQPQGSADNVMIVENQQRKIFQLDNTGMLRTREVKIDAQAWPDYVFTPEYRLMPLKEVEAYIEQEGHLPNVPSAQEVETEGQNLGEMNKILLEKIEELTLHLIEQQKQIDQLKEELEKK